MRPPVTSKADMYSRIVRGEFGNTLPRWFDYAEWASSGAAARIPLWGVQHSTVAGFPGTRLNVPTADVGRCIADGGFGTHYVISPMIGATRWEGDVCRRIPEWGPGLVCSGNARPSSGSWRTHMKTPRRWEGSAANVLLRAVLNDNSYDDVMTLIEEFPDHVIELSALDDCFGTVPGRNAVIWEVRRY